MGNFEDKKQFFNSIIEAAMALGYSDPGYYVDEYYEMPYIYDNNGIPRQSIAGDSPFGIIIDFAKVLEEDQ